MTTTMKQTTKLENEIIGLCKQMVHYYEDPAFAYQEEAAAAEATAGNVGALEALASALNTRLERLLQNDSL
jgi:hypothetical protein